MSYVPPSASAATIRLSISNPCARAVDSTYNEYDVNGNLRYTGTRSYALSGSSPDQDLLVSRRTAASYYGADQKLMFHQVLQDSLWNPSRRSSSIRMNAPGRLRSTGTMRWAGGY
jgi:hypothetical protein